MDEISGEKLFRRRRQRQHHYSLFLHFLRSLSRLFRQVLPQQPTRPTPTPVRQVIRDTPSIAGSAGWADAVSGGPGYPSQPKTLAYVLVCTNTATLSAR
jgi:hypothetical protein